MRSHVLCIAILSAPLVLGAQDDDARLLRVAHDRDRGTTSIEVNAAPLAPCAQINVFRSHTPITEENLIFCPLVATLNAARTTCSLQAGDSGDVFYALTTSDPYKRQNRTWLKRTLVGPVAEVCRTPPLPPHPVRRCANGRAFLEWSFDGNPALTEYRIHLREADGRKQIGTLPAPEISGTVRYEIPVALVDDRDHSFSVTALNASGLESAVSAPVALRRAPDLELAQGGTVARNVDFSISRMFPLVDKPVTLSVTIHNRGLTAAHAVRVMVTAVHDKSGTTGVLLERQIDLPADRSSRLEFAWTPAQSGEHRLMAVVDPCGNVPEMDEGNNRAAVLIPVVKRDVYIACYGSPLEGDWCNLPNAREAEIGEWKRRGAIAGFCGMVGNNEEAYRRRIKAGFNGVSVDEIGGYDAGTASFIQWLTGLKSDHPDFFIALWMAASPSPELLANPRIDLYLGENYYRIGSPLGAFDSHIARARQTGIIGKHLLGLSANVEDACRLGHTYSVAEQLAWIEKQMIYIAQNAPEMPGIAIYGGREGLTERIDQLCYEHFVKPRFEEERP